MLNEISSSSELFKLNYFDSQGWNHHQQHMDTTTTIRNPISYNLEEDRNKHHLRHFSANDRRIRNSTYSPSSSTASSSSSSSFSTSAFAHQQLPSSVVAPMSTCISSHLVSSSHTFNANTTSPSSTTNTTTTTSNANMELDKQASNPRRLRFEIVLEAATAVTQKVEESAITYLNRGQVYGIQLNDKRGRDQIVTSTLSIAFHSASHRRTAESYWKFWIGQQKQTEARAIDIDANQSTGITSLSFPSFDKITFDWNGKYGAKIYVRFKCLSTDFSRIKGVKGIPLRTQMETHVDADLIAGVSELDEVCFCKVKLFRDKGAERKNKDDAKQISKQLEKVYGKATEQSLPLMYNVSLPYSVFGEIPTSSTLDTFEHAADDSTFSMQLNKATRYHTRVMTAPNPVFHRGIMSASCCKESSPLATVKIEETSDMPSPPVVPSSIDAAATTVLSSSSPLYSTLAPNDCNTSTAFAAKTEENYDFYSYLTQQQQALATLPSIDTNNLTLDTISLSSHQNLLDTGFDDLGTTPFDEDLPPLSADTLYTPNTMQATPIDYQDQHHAMTTFEKAFYTHNNNLILTPDLIMDPPSSHSAFIYQQPNINNTAQETPLLTPAAAAAASVIATSASVNTASIYDVFTPEEIQQPHQSCSITPTQDDHHESSTSPHQINALQQQRDYFCAMQTTSSNLSMLQQQLQLHNEAASSIILNSNALSSMLLLSSPPSQQEQQTNNAGVLRKKSTTSIKKQQQENADYNSDSSSASGGSHQSSSKKRRYYTSCPI